MAAWRNWGPGALFCSGAVGIPGLGAPLTAPPQPPFMGGLPGRKFRPYTHIILMTYIALTRLESPVARRSFT